MFFQGSNISEFDSQTLAVLRGRVVRYLMRSKEVRRITRSVDSVDIFVGLCQMNNIFVYI